MASVVYTGDNLPNGMIGLSTPTGQAMLQRAPIANDLMVERFRKQVRPTYCGPASLAVLINALNLAYRIKYMEVQGSEDAKVNFIHEAESGRQFTVSEDDIVNQTDVKKYLSSETNINLHGLNIRQVANVASILGLGVITYYACGHGICESDEIMKKLNDSLMNNELIIIKTSEEFKRFASDYIRRPVTGVIINYNLPTVGYPCLSGHFSPLAAYDEETDRFLVMDVWLTTPPAWVEADLIFKAMSTIDSDSNLPRGMLHIYELI